MVLGITTIQKNRGPWLLEWFAFHYLMGFRKFYFYAHQCTDNTHELLLSLARKIDLNAIALDQSRDQIQLAAYQHACDNFLNEVDWMAFIDGDEFLFSPSHDTLDAALAELTDMSTSALGVYNVNFGSNGHIAEPKGNIIENYRTCNLDPSFWANRRIKSIVKGHQVVSTSTCSHIFNTPHGTVDELLRPINWGFVPDYEPSFKNFRLNHYICQSYEYFQQHKRTSGHADASATAVREQEWWDSFDQNKDYDESLTRFYGPLKETMEWLAN